MSELKPFISYFIEESLKKRSLHELSDADINQACRTIHEEPVDISPPAFGKGM